MKNISVTLLWLLVSVGTATAQDTKPSQPPTPTIELVEGKSSSGKSSSVSGSSFPRSVELSAENCSTGQAAWVQSDGPANAEIMGAGPNTIARIDKPGDYSFEYSCCQVDRKQSLLNSPSLIGFGENTTGGAASAGISIVTNTNDAGPGSLREALGHRAPTWITFDSRLEGQTIYLDSVINVTSKDITIDGRGAHVTISPTKNNSSNLLVFRGGNTILHGFTVDGRGWSGTAVMIREGKNYWVDHVTITGNPGDDALAVGQGNRPNTSATDLTISNFKVHKTSKGLQAGGNGNYPNFPQHRITVHTSELAAKDRNPRIQYGGQTHVFNSYIHSHTYGGMDSGRNAIVISENNVFSALNAKNPGATQAGRYDSIYYPGEDHKPVGHIFSKGDLFLDMAGAIGSINPKSPKPYTIPYDYNLVPANTVMQRVSNNAGAHHTDNQLQSCVTQETKISF